MRGGILVAVAVVFNRTDITDICGPLTVSRTLKQVAAVLNIEIQKTPSFVPNVGDEISIKDGSNEFFYGFVWTIESSGDSISNKIIAFSPLIYLTKNVASNSVFNNTPINTVLTSAANEAGLEFEKGDYPNNNVTVNARRKSIYDVIRLALDELSRQTGKPHFVEYVDRKIKILTGGEVASNVIKYRQGTSVGTITSKTYKDSLDTMVNKVLVMDKDGNVKDYVSSDDEKRFGTVSVIANKGSYPQNLLKPPKVSINVGIIADWTYTTGKAVELESNGKRAYFLIVSDKHSYSNGVHTADLNLERW